jgi:hypothetical protein
VRAQRDTSYISSRSPANNFTEERLEGFRIRATGVQRDAKGKTIPDAEFIYQREKAGAWRCERTSAERRPPPIPGLDLSQAGDAGFKEIDGRRARGFVLTQGAFLLRAPATVWIDVETLHVRRQEADSALRGRREVWTYVGFNQPLDIRAPSTVPCTDA